MRVVVIGAGVMGCATSLALHARGVRDIVVLERAVPGAEASSAAAGMLAAQVESYGPAELARFVAARNGYGAWAHSLRELTGVDIGYRRCGALKVARAAGQANELESLVAAHRREGLNAELVRGSALRALEPELADNALCAAWFPDEAQVDPPLLLRALAAAIVHESIQVRSGVTVSGVVCERGRCVGVTLVDQTSLSADAVVLAAGSWSSLVPGLPVDIPHVRPIRGQLLMLDQRPPRLRTIVVADHAYLVPRGDGRVICGTTMEDVGHRREVTAAGIASILASSIAIAPRLGDAAFVRTWNNFRPHSASGEPLVGASSVPGLFLATGHHRNGILLANETAQAVADAVMMSGGAASM